VLAAGHTATEFREGARDACAREAANVLAAERLANAPPVDPGSKGELRDRELVQLDVFLVSPITRKRVGAVKTAAEPQDPSPGTLAA